VSELFVEWVKENREFLEKLKSDGHFPESLNERIDEALRILDR
jgi:hypothetical protein